jgi:phage tail tape-measure protein
MKNSFEQTIIAGAVALAMASSGAALAEMTDGKKKATAIGAGTGAVAGAVVGGPVGAVVGAGVGGYVGNKGTDANGRVDGDAGTTKHHSSHAYRTGDDVRKAQVALNSHGYAVKVDGVCGPSTERALRDFQAKNGLAKTGELDSATMSKLGVA